MSDTGFSIEPSDAPLIEKLVEHHRQLITHDGTYAEMAEEFKIPIGTVRSRLNRARKALIALREAQ